MRVLGALRLFELAEKLLLAIDGFGRGRLGGRRMGSAASKQQGKDERGAHAPSLVRGAR